MRVSLCFKITSLVCVLALLSACLQDSTKSSRSTSSSSLSPSLSNLLSSSTPLLVQDLPDNGVVTSANEANFQISGFCKFNGQEIEISTDKPENKTVTCTNNTWSVALNLTPNVASASVSDESENVSVKILSGSFITTLQLPRKLNTTVMDLLVAWGCSGNSACTTGQEAQAGTVQTLKVADLPVQVACSSGKSINVKAYPYQQGAINPDATIEFDKTITCNPQGRALFTVSSTNAICYTLPPSGPGCTGLTECRLQVKATEDGQQEDVEEVIVVNGASCVAI